MRETELAGKAANEIRQISGQIDKSVYSRLNAEEWPHEPRKPSFANLRGSSAPATSAPKVAIVGPPGGGEADKARPSRQGGKQIAGFFSHDMSFVMHRIARCQRRSLQALIAEAFNDVLRKH